MTPGKTFAEEYDEKEIAGFARRRRFIIKGKSSGTFRNVISIWIVLLRSRSLNWYRDTENNGFLRPIIE